MEQPRKYSQQSLLPFLKQDLIKVLWSGELLDLASPYSQILQDVVHRVDKAFQRYITGDCNGKRSGKPRFKGESRYRSFTYPQANRSWLEGNYINIPKIGKILVRWHRPLPDGFSVKTCQLIEKADGWYINLAIEDKSVPKFNPEEILPTEDNSTGIDMGLEKFLTTSEGEMVPIYQPLRKNQGKLTKISQRKNKKKRGSTARRKLANQESKLYQKIARNRKDNHFNVAIDLVSGSSKVFIVEELNLQGMTRRNKPKQDEKGNYLPNGQAAKSGLNKSFADAGVGQVLSILTYKAENAGKRVVKVKPDYTSQICACCDNYVPKELTVRTHECGCGFVIDRDWNAALNIKRVGLGVFPTIKRCKGNPGIKIKSVPNSTLKEILELTRSLRHTI